VKYAPTGEAITRYRYSIEGRTPRKTSLAYANGRR